MPDSHGAGAISAAVRLAASDLLIPAPHGYSLELEGIFDYYLM